MYIIHTSSQNTRHQKLNSYWVMNSLGDKICPPAAPSTPVNRKPKSNTGMSQKQVMPKNEGLSMSLEINTIITV